MVLNVQLEQTIEMYFPPNMNMKYFEDYEIVEDYGSEDEGDMERNRLYDNV